LFLLFFLSPAYERQFFCLFLVMVGGVLPMRAPRKMCVMLPSPFLFLFPLRSKVSFSRIAGEAVSRFPHKASRGECFFFSPFFFPAGSRSSRLCLLFFPVILFCARELRTRRSFSPFFSFRLERGSTWSCLAFLLFPRCVVTGDAFSFFAGAGTPAILHFFFPFFGTARSALFLFVFHLRI